MKYIKTYENLLKGMSEERMKNKLSEKELIKAFIKLGTFDNLPRNEDGVCFYDGDLDLRYDKLNILPDNLTVNGNLDCSSNMLTKLPENLIVNGDLSCSNQQSDIILELPHSAKVSGNFYNIIKLIRTTYQSITPSDDEDGDYEVDNGWEDEDGESMMPDEYDIEDGLSAVDKAVDFLSKKGVYMPSSSQFMVGVSYTSGSPDINYNTGEETYYSCHLSGFTTEEEQEIYNKMKKF